MEMMDGILKISEITPTNNVPEQESPPVGATDWAIQGWTPPVEAGLQG